MFARHRADPAYWTPDRLAQYYDTSAYVGLARRARGRLNGGRSGPLLRTQAYALCHFVSLRLCLQ